MAYLNASYSVTAAGSGNDALWTALCEKRDLSQSFTITDFPRLVPPSVHAYRVPDLLSTSAENRIAHLLDEAYRGLSKKLSLRSTRLGIIFASTKGLSEDIAWLDSVSPMDPLGPILDAFLNRHNLQPEVQICLSNACTSGISALHLGQRWMESDRVDEVLVISSDVVGAFVLNGFYALRALSPTPLRPFDEKRAGMRIGEAAVAILMEREARGDFPIRLRASALDVEGFSITRPQEGGRSFKRALEALALPSDLRLGAIIAHGTGTLANDEVESATLSEVFPSTSPNHQVGITASKGCIGHSLGASSAVDICAAIEALRHGKIFPITNTTQVAPQFRNRFLLESEKLLEPRILINSLGFGGIHAVCVLETEK